MDMRINWMSLLSIHSELKSILKEAIKNKDYKTALKIIEKLFSKPSLDLNKEYVDGIFFKDVKSIVKSKEDLENILLSTKVLFESKEEVLEFFDMLLKYGFKENAISYFDDLISQLDDIELIDGFNTLLRK